MTTLRFSPMTAAAMLIALALVILGVTLARSRANRKRETSAGAAERLLGPLPAHEAGGPDYSAVDSLAKAAEWARAGRLEKMLLVPVALGGRDVPENTVYVPVGFGELKARTDENIVQPLVAEGRFTEYRAEPRYEGRSVVPVEIVMSATGPGNLRGELVIWGDALRNQHDLPEPSASFAAPPADTTRGAGKPVEGSAVARVTLFLADWAGAWHAVRAQIDGDPLGGLDRWDASIAALDERHFVRGVTCGSQGAFSRVRADHDPATEAVVSSSVQADRATVRTVAPSRFFMNRKTQYVYRLVRSGGEWRIASLVEDQAASEPVRAEAQARAPTPATAP